ncbi:MAG: hypothetical protein WC830_06630 [Burkholderiales bacterium]|jgi:hypothetical protein
MKLIVAFVGLFLLVPLPVAAQLGTSGRLAPQKFCSSSDNSIECVSQRNQANIDRFYDKYKDEARQQSEKLEAERLERERQRTIREKDCNPRVQRCD